ncbi:MAG: phosphoribosylanthranilate isomerase, partial [Desulfuromonadales bacterium]|nr:phosphoribosylanthranilate isomerase [Desulfuromonadales bacterium]
MPQVKICGITRLEDALCAIDAGADALGFVFYEKSPRCIVPEQARRMISKLPPFVTTVGLFVNEEPERVRLTAEFCGLNTVQLHGDETPKQCHYSALRVIKALRLQQEMDEAIFSSYPVSALLLDAYV